ncbi:tRNA guanosine(34) transglycosylase Tgt [Candidatus Woesearchaeota archaeon]|nr:tRNA guanosine(34) transglycosylase Tgt [Candidatus Woesearchaeota archaeon]
MDFKIKSKEGRARVGEIITAHGIIETPEFIPVATQATVKAVSSEILEKIGVQAVLANTYHLYLRPGTDVVEKFGGLHKFMGWSKPMFTDSGGFQVFSLCDIRDVDEDGVIFCSHLDKSKHSLTPEKSIEIQEKLGADIIFTLDECIPFESDYETAKKSVERTHKWAKRCLEAHKSKQALFGIVQGGKFEDLRRESAKFIGGLGFDGYGLGSIFGEPKEETLKVIGWMMEELPEEKPKHLLGIGAVEDIFNGVEMGVDTFDCVLPTRLARVGYIFTSEGNLKSKWRYRITNAQYKGDMGKLDKNCGCSVCQRYSRAYLYHLFKTNELLAYALATEHNLWFFNNLMREIRSAISNGKFKEMKEKWLG